MLMASRIKCIKGKYYDVGTSNVSFLQLAMDLKALNVENYFFMLEIKDYSIVGVDPYQCDKETGMTTLSKDQISRIISECARNIWYFLREVCRIPDQGNPNGIPYKANRGNIAQTWLFLHGIDSWLCLPRQQGKTQSALAAQNWAYNFGTTNSTFIFINKDGDNSKENLKRLNDQIDLLPEYLRFQAITDEEGKVTKARRNATMSEHPVTKNKIITKAKATSKDSALSLARGLTAPILHFDEPEFTNQIDVIVSNSVSTYETAARNSKRNGTMYARIFTCTPGDLDTSMGLAAQILLDKTVPWTEKMYDMSTEKMEEYVRHAKGGESNRIVYIEFQYYQIGLTRQWLEEISAKIGDRLTVRREILLQRLHGSSDSPYDQEDLEYIIDQQKNPIDQVYVNEFYAIDIYKKLRKDIPYIMSIDCATGTNGDNNAITFLNPYTVEPDAEFECSYIGETDFEQLIISIVKELVPRAIVVIERNSVGDGILDHLLKSDIADRLYFDKSRDLIGEKIESQQTVESMLKRQAAMKKYYGVYTEGHSRKYMFDILSRHVREFKENFVTKNITRDLTRLVRLGSGKIAAGPGFHDDSIMSYLIGLYVFYHGNNLESYGFERGLDEPEKRHRGLHEYAPEELSEVLPEELVDAIQKQKAVHEELEYENVLKNAIIQSQKETEKIRKSKFARLETKEPRSDYYDDYDDGSIDLDFFDTLNNF